MTKLSYRISYYVLYALFVVIVAVLAMFYFSGFGQTVSMNGETFVCPAYTDLLLGLVYGVLGLCVAVTLFAAVAQFGSALIANPVEAVKSLSGIILLVILLGITYSMSSDAGVLTGDGLYTDAFWLKISGMLLQSVYFLLGFTIFAIIAGSVKKMFS
ncbi:MAG: hypothetical protein WCQ82_00065 [Bacteroidaceae bacterium]|nr:hypothetical protein [Bacteroidaceae bacterium]